MPRGKGKRKKKDGVNAGIRRGEPIAPDAARGGSGGADPSKSGSGGADPSKSGSGGADGTVTASARKRGAEGVPVGRNVRYKSSSDEDGSSSSSSSKSISAKRDDSLARGAGPFPSPLVGEASAQTPRSSSSPLHDSTLIEGNLRIYRKEALDDDIKSNKFRFVRHEPRPIGGQSTKDLRLKSTSSPEASISAGSESTSSKSSAKSYSSYCEAASLGGSTSSSKASGQRIAKKQSGQRGPTDKSVAAEFIEFLNGYVVAGEEKPYYPALLKAMKDRGGCFELTVKFEHILKENKKLALNILKRSYLCRPCAIQFMVDQQFAPEAEVAERATVDMYDMPKSIQALKEILKDKKSLLTLVEDILNPKNVSVRVLTELAQALLIGFLAEVRSQHKKGRSWNGEYTIEDMLLVDGCDCRITKEPYDYLGSGAAGRRKSDSEDSFKRASKKVNSFDTARAKDVAGLEKIFSAELLVDENGNKEKDADIPLFFESLQQDMSNVTAKQVKSENFWTYLLNHPALKPPIVRNSLIVLLKTILCDNPRGLSSPLQTLLDTVMVEDWRELARDLEVFKDVYSYQVEEEKRKQGNSCQAEEVKGKQREEKDSNKKCQQKEPFDNTFLGLLIFNRHFLQHANRIVNTSDPTQLEIYFSSRFKYLPKLLRLLVNLQDDIKRCFADVLELYASHKAQFKNGTNEKKTLSFW